MWILDSPRRTCCSCPGKPSNAWSGSNNASRCCRCSIGLVLSPASRPSAPPSGTFSVGLAVHHPRARHRARDDRSDHGAGDAGILRDDEDPAPRRPDVRSPRPRHRVSHERHRQRVLRDALLREPSPPVGRQVDVRFGGPTDRRTRWSAWSRMRATTCASRRRRLSTSRSRCRARHPARARDRRFEGYRDEAPRRSPGHTPLLRVTTVTSQTATVDRTLVRERLLALLSGFFALVGLVLTAVGLYGTLSYAVVQRTREIGIRVAPGRARSVRCAQSWRTPPGRR